MSNEDRIQALVTNFTTSLRSEIESQVYEKLQQTIGSLRGGGAVAPRRGPGRPPKNPPGTSASTAPNALAGSKKPMSPAMAAARKLQGQYIGFLRKLDSGKRERVQKVARSEGVAEAMKLAQSLLGSGGGAGVKPAKKTPGKPGRKPKAAEAQA